MKIDKMKKRIIVTKQQLHEYVERKKAERIFCSIIDRLHKNSQFLSEQVSLEKSNQSVIENYRRKNLITPHVEMLLEEYGIINEKGQII